MRASHGALSLSALGVAMFATADGRADSEQERTKLYQEGKALADAGKYAAAADKFSAVIAIRSAPKALIALAAMEEKQGHLVAARSLYAQAEHDASAAKLVDDRRIAEAGRARVDVALPRLSVHMGTGISSSPSLSLDDNPRAPPWHEIVLDPGEHRIVVTAAGYEPFTLTFDVGVREHRKIDVTLRRTDRVPVEPTRRSPTPWAPIALGGAGLVVSVSGFLVYRSGRDDEQGRKDVCPNFVCPDGQSTDNPGKAKIILGDVMMVTGGVAVVGSVIWFVTRQGPSASSTAAARVQPMVSPTSGGLSISFSGVF